ncbi:MAG TPA: MFS transporter [Stellaceae bacterium]|jgi:EmrB/QacA subfamily drug resistance transporter
MIMLGRTPCDDGVIRAGADASACSARAKPWVLAATILGSSLAFIDGSVVNVALPSIQASLGASSPVTQWIINAYLLMLGALILVGGAAGDRFGRRRVFVQGIILFTAASVVCGFAPNASILVAARAAQGIGGAMLVPGSLAIISAAFSQEERGQAIGTWAGFSALTTALGPVLGGTLVDAWSWRAVFFINVPLAIVTLAITVVHVPESRASASDAPIDWTGAVLATIGLAGIAFGASAASEMRWGEPAVFAPLSIGAAVLILFIRHEGRAAAPMVPLRLFRSAVFSGTNAMTLLLYTALSGALFFLPFDLIRLQHYTAAAAGASFLPFSLIMGLLSRRSGALMDRYGARLPLVLGPAIAAGGLALLALPAIGGSYWLTFFPPMVCLGIGMVIAVAPLTATVMGAVDQRQAGTASGINNAVARIANLLGVALFGALAAGISASALDHASDAAFLRAFRGVMLAAAALALVSALCAALTIPGVTPRAASAPRARRPG